MVFEPIQRSDSKHLFSNKLEDRKSIYIASIPSPSIHFGKFWIIKRHPNTHTHTRRYYTHHSCNALPFNKQKKQKKKLYDTRFFCKCVLHHVITSNQSCTRLSCSHSIVLYSYKHTQEFPENIMRKVEGEVIVTCAHAKLLSLLLKYVRLQRELKFSSQVHWTNILTLAYKYACLRSTYNKFYYPILIFEFFISFCSLLFGFGFENLSTLCYRSVVKVLFNTCYIIRHANTTWSRVGIPQNFFKVYKFLL